MRESSHLLRCFCLLGSAALVACGSSKKPAADPSAEAALAAQQEETPKWEGAAPPQAPNPTTTGSSRGVNEAPTRRSDQYDQEATEVVLKRAARQVKANCGAAKDDTGKATGPWGKATLLIQLGHNGHSKGLTIPPPFMGKPPGNCIEKAFTNLTFPPWGGGDTQVEWVVEIVQPGAADKK